MRSLIRCGVVLLVLLLLFGWVDDAQMWWRSYLRGSMEVQLVGCEDIQYAIEKSIPGETIYFPGNECVIVEPIVIGIGVRHVTLTGGMFTGTAALGERSIFAIVDKDVVSPQ